jgi:ubiquitin-like modifier-activating enzyme ATG7
LNSHQDVPSRFIVDETSFHYDAMMSPERAKHEWRIPGVLYNTNTLEAFKNLDKNSIVEKARQTVTTFLCRSSFL